MRAAMQNTDLKIEVEDFGAVLSSIKSQKTGHEFLWQGNPAIWNGQSPILFPIIGKLLNDRCVIGGKTYEIIRHGLARRRRSRRGSKPGFLFARTAENIAADGLNIRRAFSRSNRTPGNIPLYPLP